jgi:hypothetical protein
MQIRRITNHAWFAGIAGLLLTISSASANTIISYTTNAPGTGFTTSGNPSLLLNSTGGVAATLTFVPNTNSNTGVPSNIDLGDFILVCTACTTAQTTTFGSFTFNLVVSDTTDGATGQFTGTSSGGTVSSNSSSIQVNWTAPAGLIIGGGTNHALTGNFGNTAFDLTSPISLIVAPNSGTPPGDTTIQGQVVSAPPTTPEPTTFAMIGGGLLGLGLLRRRKQTV